MFAGDGGGEDGAATARGTAALAGVLVAVVLAALVAVLLGAWSADRADARRVVDALHERSGPELDTLLQDMDDEQLSELFTRFDRLPRADGAATIAAIGEVVELTTWRRLGEVVDAIDPDPSQALPDDVRDAADPSDLDHYDALVYAPFDGPLAVRGPDDDHAFARTDFAQGITGDCFLIIAMLAIIDADPELLAGMYQANANGTYTITFADGTPIVVGPDLPVHPDRPDSPVFARDVGGDAAPRTELYAPLLEKAYAQYRGGWDEIVGGWPAATIQHLVGGSYETIDHGKVTLDELRSWTRDGQPVTVGTLPDPRDPADGLDYPPSYPRTYHDRRLVHQHAYVVDGVDPVTDEVLLVNPGHPTRDPVRLTLDEFRTSMRRVHVTTLPQ